MKEIGTAHWTSPNSGATNLSGFTGLPGGYRLDNGSFSFVGDYGYWWSSTEVSTTGVWDRSLTYGQVDLFRNDDNKNYGFSVRCLRD